MKIQEVIEAVFQKHRLSMVNAKSSNHVPKISVYMDYEFYMCCKKEISGQVDHQVYLFLTEDKIFGHPIYKVIESTTQSGTIKHQPYKVVVDD